MAESTSPHLAPLPLGRRIGFVLVTVAAFVLDALTLVPGADERDGARWRVFGAWEPSVLEFVLFLAAGYAVLLLRRRWPLTVLAWMGVVTVASTLMADPGLPVAGLLVTLYTAAALLHRRWHAWLAVGFAVVAQCVGLGIFNGGVDVDYLLGVLLLGGISVSLWLFGRRDHQATLAAAGLAGQLAEHGQLAAAQERRRIARELHDIVAHSVSAMMMQAAGAKAVTSALRQDMTDDLRLATVERALATIENTGSQSMRELHRLLSVMRGDGAEVESADSESSSQPGMADIAPLVELTRHSGLVVEVHTAGSPVRLDPSVGLAAYRVVQESLTNAMKHGGRGAIVDIFQNWQPDGLQLQVRSRAGHEGTPPGSLGGGGGLAGLHERVELIGGSFESGWVGDDFVATAVLPLTPTVRPELGRPGAANGSTGSSALPATELHGRHAARLDGARGDSARADSARRDNARADGAGVDSRRT